MNSSYKAFEYRDLILFLVCVGSICWSRKVFVFCSSDFIIDVVLVFSLLAVGIQLLFVKLLYVAVYFNIIFILMKMLGENMFFIHIVC